MVVGPGGVGTSENSGPGCWIPSVGKTPKRKNCVKLSVLKTILLSYLPL